MALSGSEPNRITGVCLWKRERACLQCMFPSSSSSSSGGQTSLLAVMLSEGGERAASHCSCIPAAGTQTHQLLLSLGWPSDQQLPDPSFLLAHDVDSIFGICFEYLGCQLVHKKLCNFSPNSSIS